MVTLNSHNLRIVNRLLVAVILLINVYILLLPLLPQIDLWHRQQRAKALSGLPYKTVLKQSNQTDSARADIPSDNRLIIPKLAIDQHIYTGNSPYLVNKGVWAKPNASTPPLGSNTVLVAHRFTYSGKSIFYSLDRVDVGDKVVVYWQGKEYDYTVRNSTIVPASQVSVESPTDQAQLTLYTCAPLWNPVDRLVVVASKDGAN